ncbi:hypothetical protein JAAARDRAFT_183441 [Jaapia argillacea MUCL 33604]|uniref:Uncharacterized protein n=1 Tax=Jaapia argillacea MUCL 33604 TaxID=933084 RepID=A0A067PS33_9AGAM|nr:hypothetical protein JAAARDRAFT_183441 [Jaapia argillacea MUCL 33604]
MANIADHSAPNVNPGPLDETTPLYTDFIEAKRDCPQFRILIIGRANAGKTTILQKVCNAKPGTKPIIYDKDGNKLRSSWFKQPTTMRGEHDIQHQITYPGSNFVFHDSRGFEAGSEKELQTVKEFIDVYATYERLRDRLHVIWYCIPLDGDRPVSAAEMTFFEIGTGDVPVVAIFTKFDAQIVKAVVELKSQGQDLKSAWKEAPQYALENFQQQYLNQLKKAKYPPKEWVCLQDMDKPLNQCPELTEKTAAAINNTTLQQIFITTQANNLKLCISRAIQ